MSLELSPEKERKLSHDDFAKHPGESTSDPNVGLNHSVSVAPPAPHPKGPKSLTFRISNIPKGVTAIDLKGILTEFSSQLSALESSATPPALIGFSFAASGHSDWLSVATASFNVAPAPSQLEDAIKRGIRVDPGYLRVDLNFFGLTPVADPQNATVDIIAVTGLAGHAFGSWKARDGPYMWLRDFLPIAVPKARILTYGYDTKLPGSESNSSILELSRRFLEIVKAVRTQQEKHRPLILIGHSLGGLIVKQALVYAAEGSLGDKYVFRSLYAVMLFGVPNQGLEISSLAYMVKGQPNEDLIRNLHPSSSFLGDLNERFYDRLDSDAQIISIFETKMTRTVEWSSEKGTWQRTGPTVLMVPRFSAIRAGRTEQLHNQLSINADHSDIVKFSDPSQHDYVVIKTRIQELVKDAPQVIAKRVAGYRKKLSDIEKEFLIGLDAPNYSARRSMVEEPAPGTLGWILLDNLLRHWLSEDGPSFLWVRGTPGQGKSVFAKFLLNHLNSQQSSGILYFFFYDQDERLQTIESLLRSFIKQILATTDISDITDISNLDPSTTSDETLREILQKIIDASTLGTIYFIVDALDECPTETSRKTILRWFKKLLKVSQEKSSPVFKILFTSRPTVDISRELQQCPCLDLKANDEDLKIIIDSKLAIFDSLRNELRKDATKLLLDGAGRTFLWIAIVLRELDKITFPTLKKIQDIIAQAPTDLDELFSSIVDKIMQGPEDEQKILAWIVYGRRPLSLKELEAALATQTHSTCKKSTEFYRTQLTRKEALSSVAGVILEITNDDRVHLFHQSAKDFLLKNGRLSSARFCKGLHPRIYLAQTCITYMNFEDFKTGPCGNRTSLVERKEQYPLLSYAARNWHFHIQSDEDVKRVSDAISGLTQPGSPTLLSWAEAADIQNIHMATDLFGIATFANIQWLNGFERSTHITITDKKVIQAALQGVAGYNVLENLVRRDHVQFTEAAVLSIATFFDEGMMRLLLDRIDRCQIDGSLLEAAATNKINAVSMMRLLLQQSKNIILTGAIVRAAASHSSGNSGLIEMLLSHENMQMTDDAMSEIARCCSPIQLRLLPEEYGKIKITENIFLEASQNRSYSRDEVMILLLDKAGILNITENIVQLAVLYFGPDILLQLLGQFSDEDNVLITADVLAAAVTAGFHGEEKLTLLLDRCGDNAPITAEVLAAAVAATDLNDEEMLILLLDRCGDNAPITADVLAAAVAAVAAADFYDEEILILLLDRCGDNAPITADVLAAAAAATGFHGKEILILLLDRCGGNAPITADVLAAAVAAQYESKELLILLLDRCGDNAPITADVLAAVVVAAQYDGKKMLILLLDRCGDNAPITADVLAAAAAATIGFHGKEILILLLNRCRDNAPITADVLAAAAAAVGAGAAYTGKEMLILLLDRCGDNAPITADVLAAAAAVAAGFHGKEILILLLDRCGDNAPITADVLAAAATAKYDGKEMLLLLLDRFSDVEKVPITADLLTAAALSSPSIAKRERHFYDVEKSPFHKGVENSKWCSV